MTEPFRQTSRTTSTDSLFGMALAQAFAATVLGPAANMAWESCEIASSLYEDRAPADRKAHPYKLGAANTLAPDFESPAQGRASAPIKAELWVSQPWADYGYRRARNNLAFAS